MDQKPKEYFFYINTNECKIIKNGLDWSIATVIYIGIIHFYIDSEFIINSIMAVAIGYIISYFYFYKITYLEYSRKQIQCLMNLRYISLAIFAYRYFFKQTKNITDIKNFIKCMLYQLNENKYVFNDYLNISVFVNSMIHTLQTLIDTSDVTEDEIEAGMGRVEKYFNKSIEIFEDKDEIREWIKKHSQKK